MYLVACGRRRTHSIRPALRAGPPVTRRNRVPPRFRVSAVRDRVGSTLVIRMRRLVFLLAITTPVVALATNASAQARTIRMPTSSGSERIFAILLPQSYETSQKRYPVVYLFHGGGQDHTAFMARAAFTPMARKHEFIVVMPAADRSYSALGPEAQGRYHDYIADDLVDYVDSHYRTLPTKDRRAIAGLSMG